MPSSASSSSSHGKRRKRHRSKKDDRSHTTSSKHRKRHGSGKRSRRDSSSDDDSGSGADAHFTADEVAAADARAVLGRLEAILAAKKRRPTISKDDYFKQNNAFSAWLKTQGLAFDELTSEENHARFAKFVKAYNSGKLDASLYTDHVPPARTNHKWGFASK